MIDAGLITDVESCDRRGFYSRDYLPRRLHPTEMTRQAIYAGLCADVADPGDFAGSKAVEICSEIGIEAKNSDFVYDIGIHHAAIADLVTTWARSEFQTVLEPLEPVKVENHTWEPSCLYNSKESCLVRVVLLDHLSDDRIMGESRSWYAIGDVAVYGLPLVQWLVSLGASRNGRRHSAWSKGLLHPRNKKLRFKPQRHAVEGFKESWKKIWREDYATIGRDLWLRTMAEDGVLNDLTTQIKLDAFEEDKRDEILGMIFRKGKKLSDFRQPPEQSFSACDHPRPCPFRIVCFAPTLVSPALLNFRRRTA